MKTARPTKPATPTGPNKIDPTPFHEILHNLTVGRRFAMVLSGWRSGDRRSGIHV